MRYFRLQQHEKANAHPVLRNVFMNIQKKNISCSNHHLIAEPIFFDVVNKHSQYYDVIDQDLFLVSELLWNVFQIYDPQMESKIVTLIDKHHMRIENYFLPIFHEVDCISNNSKFNHNKTVITELRLDDEKICKEEVAIFCIKVDINPIVIVRLDAAESLLRRNLIGIQFQELQLD